jgi:hypothetical protein
LKLTPADRAHLAFLNRQVDRLQDESFRLDPHPNVKQDLDRARRELNRSPYHYKKKEKYLWMKLR